MRGFAAVDDKLFFSRDDLADPRLGDFARKADDSASLYVAGYPDDEGVKNNGGRLGAAQGPDRIRHFLYRMTPNVWTSRSPSFFDIGNLTLTSPLDERHHNVRASLVEALKAKKRWLSFGGGHDYGYPDGAGFLEVFATQRPLVINFDAHLDVRPLDKTINSGTPFWRLLSEFKNFDFIEIGIQSQCNSRLHLDWAKDHGAKILSLTEIRESGLSASEKILSFLENDILRRRPCYLSFDMDVVSSSFAPGCSQSWPTGISPSDLFTTLSVLLKRLDVRVLGIYEVAPPLDVSDITAKLAAEIAHLYISEAE